MGEWQDISSKCKIGVSLDYKTTPFFQATHTYIIMHFFYLSIDHTIHHSNLCLLSSTISLFRNVELECSSCEGSKVITSH